VEDGKTFSQMVKEAGFMSSAINTVAAKAPALATGGTIWTGFDLLDKGRTNIDPNFSQQLNQVRAQKNMQTNKAADGFQ